MPKSMASLNILGFLFLLPLPTIPFLKTLFVSGVPIQSTEKYPFTCSVSELNNTCNSILYQSNGFNQDRIAHFYSVSTSQVQPITHGNKQDYLVSVPCSCKKINGTVGYFYDAIYTLKLNDTFFNISNELYSGQAWPEGDEEKIYVAGKAVAIHLLCGCSESDSQTMVTYTVQQDDTIYDIATLLSAQISEVESMNKILIQNPPEIDLGWVLYVPMWKNETQDPKKGKGHKWTIIISILSAVTLLSMCTLAIILLRRKSSQNEPVENPKVASKSISANKPYSTQNDKKIEDTTFFESERPVVYSLEEIAEATCNFNETRKIGEGGYGCVYLGLIGEQEVAIKKMRSSMTKEFLAELKILCKIHHINVVELLGYASGDNHLYLVYEFIPNGSLNDHLHDALLKGHQPPSWIARAQIALDAAKGIEYIHDHTKARYVHRDIKTSNILLDMGLRAKVADFGLAKLVGRTNEDDLIATRLVGTPGYLPPESVKELQVTTKTDVFAFGVVLAEFITGQRALIRDSREPNKMRSLITIVHEIFQDEDPENALGSIIDGNLKGNYPKEDVYKMAEIAYWCLSEEAMNRPEMREVVVALSEIWMSSVQWEASLGGHSQVFSGVVNGR